MIVGALTSEVRLKRKSFMSAKNFALIAVTFESGDPSRVVNEVLFLSKLVRRRCEFQAGNLSHFNKLVARSL